MEFLRILNSHAFVQWLAQSLAIFFLLGGFVVLAVGLGLFFNSERTLRLFGPMNRWVSMRRTTRPLEIARDTRPIVLRHRRLIAAACILGGVFALYGLFTHFDAKAVIYVYRLEIFKPSFAGWIADSARWILIVGNAAAIVIGLALAFSPSAVAKLEAAGSRWYSERQATKGADDMKTPLDDRVAAYPRYSGVIMMFFGLVLIGVFGSMLAGIR
jgi:hypothetical protein